MRDVMPGLLHGRRALRIDRQPLGERSISAGARTVRDIPDGRLVVPDVMTVLVEPAAPGTVRVLAHEDRLHRLLDGAEAVAVEFARGPRLHRGRGPGGADGGRAG